MIVNDELSRMQINAVRPGTELNQGMEFSSVKDAVSIGSIASPVASLDTRMLTSAISQEDMERHEQAFRAISEARKKFDEVCSKYQKTLAVKLTLDGEDFPIVRAKDLVRDYVRIMEKVGIMDYDALKEAIRLQEQLEQKSIDVLRRRNAEASNMVQAISGKLWDIGR